MRIYFSARSQSHTACRYDMAHQFAVITDHCARFNVTKWADGNALTELHPFFNNSSRVDDSFLHKCAHSFSSATPTMAATSASATLTPSTSAVHSYLEMLPRCFNFLT